MSVIIADRATGVSPSSGEPILSSQVKIKPEEAKGRAFVDRLLLDQLTELDAVVKLGELAQRLSEHGIGLATVRSLLASNPERFAYAERRWIPASRLEAIGRPLAEAVRVMLARYGAPVALGRIESELGRIRTDTATLRDAIKRLAENDPTFIFADGDLVALAEWAFIGGDMSTERAFRMNGVQPEEVEAIRKKLGKFDWRADDAIAQALAKLAPVSAKALAAAFWCELNSQDPRAILLFRDREFFAELITTPGFTYLDGEMHPQGDMPKWIAAANKVADKLSPLVEVEDAAPIEVRDEDVEKMVTRIQHSEQTITATKLLEDFYEITPSNKTFPDDMANVLDALTTRSDVWWVGGDRLRKPNSAPDFIFSVPEVFTFVPSGVLDEEGEPVDVELDDDGLSSSLRKLLVHPLATDVLDEDIMPQPKTMPEQIRLVLKTLHRELGTLPMCQFPTGWLDPKPSVQELIFVDPSGRELQVWANHEARLLFNLVDWWFEQPVESGAVFTLTKTAKPNVFEFEWLDQTDPVIFISAQRMEELREMQANSEGKSTLQILIEVMAHWQKGADFLSILAQVNVVRRTSRRLLASLLSSYQCFYQRSGSPVWHFDNKKVELGFDKTKKRFVRK